MIKDQSSASATSTPDGTVQWSKLNIALHWLIVGLVAFQYFQGEWMAGFFDGGLEGRTMDTATVSFGYAHIFTGLSILVAVPVRLWDRFTCGRPSHPAEVPNWANTLARITHAALYAMLFALPVAGLVTWLTGNEWLGDMHSNASSILIGLIALHVTGALANHFWFKTDVLRSMLPRTRVHVTLDLDAQG